MMTTTEASFSEPVTEDDLKETLLQVDPSVLLNCLVQVTGDVGLLDRYEPGFVSVPVRSVLESHVVDDATAGAIATQLAQELAGRLNREVALTELEPALFQRLATFVVGEPVDEEFLPILEEQAGFVLSRRVIPVTRTPPPDFNVIVIGAGMVGINAGVKLAEAGFSYQIFESRSELGGTWSINRYPGAAVDTPSHYYSYSFEPNPDWSHFYPVGDEYHRYLTMVSEKYGVTPHITFNTSVLSCAWNEERQRWLVRTSTNGEIAEHEAAAVVTALGFLNRPIIPNFPGRESFGGVVMHSAQWDSSVDLKGKRVALVGAGCTAVQIAEAIADDVAALTVVQRQPHWVAPAKTSHGAVPPALQWVLNNVPYYHRWFRLKTYWYASDKNYLTPRIDPEWQKTHVSASPANDVVMQACMKHIEASFADRPDLKAKLVPDFPPYAKRIVRDPGYYRTLLKDNVTLLTGTIDHYEADGVVLTGGEKVTCDVVLLATGFTIDMLTKIDITGRRGLELAEVWVDDPRAYLAVLNPGFPNLFTTAGPNSAPNHGGGHNLTSEEQVHYIVECLQLLLEEDATAMEVTQEATDEYNRRVDEELDKTVWQHGGTASGYYRNAKGRAWLACPWRMVDYWTMLRAPKIEDLVLTKPPIR
jgi:cation diffusion facilitator CzcD-associated flavoprotein CzcO